MSSHSPGNYNPHQKNGYFGKGQQYFDEEDNNVYRANLEASKLNAWEKELDKIKKARHAQHLKDEMQKYLDRLKSEKNESKRPDIDKKIRKLQKLIKRIENGDYGPEDF